MLLKKMASYGIDTAVADVLTLSGSSGTPNNVYSFKIAPTDATASWRFNIGGTVYKSGTTGGTQFRPSVEWCNQTPLNSYWIRATVSSGDDPTAFPSPLTTWFPLSSARQYDWTVTGFGTKAGTIKVEISSDSSGSPIVATGYYYGEATVEP